MRTSKTLDTLIDNRTPVEVSATDAGRALRLTSATLLAYDELGYLFRGIAGRGKTQRTYFVPHGELSNIRLPDNFDLREITKTMHFDYKSNAVEYNPEIGYVSVNGKSVRLTERQNEYAQIIFQRGFDVLIPKEDFSEVSKGRHRMDKVIEHLRPKLESVGLRLVTKTGKGYVLTMK